MKRERLELVKLSLRINSTIPNSKAAKTQLCEIWQLLGLGAYTFAPSLNSFKIKHSENTSYKSS